jgi:ubiquitin-conjugating enzyme E2 Z
MEVFRDPPHGIVVVPRADDVSSIDCLITGPSDTPYEGGFFVFYIRCPPNYPLSPPRVVLLSTDKGRVRFGPNLYSSGKVCLSILG